MAPTIIGRTITAVRNPSLQTINDSKIEVVYCASKDGLDVEQQNLEEVKEEEEEEEVIEEEEEEETHPRTEDQEETLYWEFLEASCQNEDDYTSGDGDTNTETENENVNEPTLMEYAVANFKKLLNAASNCDEHRCLSSRSSVSNFERVIDNVDDDDDDESNDGETNEESSTSSSVISASDNNNDSTDSAYSNMSSDDNKGTVNENDASSKKSFTKKNKPAKKLERILTPIESTKKKSSLKEPIPLDREKSEASSGTSRTEKSGGSEDHVEKEKVIEMDPKQMKKKNNQGNWKHREATGKSKKKRRGIFKKILKFFSRKKKNSPVVVEPLPIEPKRDLPQYESEFDEVSSAGPSLCLLEVLTFDASRGEGSQFDYGDDSREVVKVCKSNNNNNNNNNEDVLSSLRVGQKETTRTYETNSPSQKKEDCQAVSVSPGDDVSGVTTSVGDANTTVTVGSRITVVATYSQKKQRSFTSAKSFDDTTRNSVYSGDNSDSESDDDDDDEDDGRDDSSKSSFDSSDDDDDDDDESESDDDDDSNDDQSDVGTSVVSGRSSSIPPQWDSNNSSSKYSIERKDWIEELLLKPFEGNHSSIISNPLFDDLAELRARKVSVAQGKSEDDDDDDDDDDNNYYLPLSSNNSSVRDEDSFVSSFSRTSTMNTPGGDSEESFSRTSTMNNTLGGDSKESSSTFRSSSMTTTTNQSFVSMQQRDSSWEDNDSTTTRTSGSKMTRSFNVLDAITSTNAVPKLNNNNNVEPMTQNQITMDHHHHHYHHRNDDNNEALKRSTTLVTIPSVLKGKTPRVNDFIKARKDKKIMMNNFPSIKKKKKQRPDPVFVGVVGDEDDNNIMDEFTANKRRQRSSKSWIPRIISTRFNSYSYRSFDNNNKNNNSNVSE